MSATHSYLNAVWTLAGQDNTAKHVLAYLADSAGGDGTTFVGQGTIARITGLHRGTVGRAVLRLVEAGLLSYVPGHTGWANFYRVTLPPASFKRGAKRGTVPWPTSRTSRTARPLGDAGEVAQSDMPVAESDMPVAESDMPVAESDIARRTELHLSPSNPLLIPYVTPAKNETSQPAGPPVSPAGETGRDVQKGNGTRPTKTQAPEKVIYCYVDGVPMWRDGSEQEDPSW